MKSVALSPEARTTALQAMGDRELDVLVVGGGPANHGSAGALSARPMETAE